MAKTTMTHVSSRTEKIEQYVHRSESASEGEAAHHLLETHGYTSSARRNNQWNSRCPFHEDPGEVPRGKSGNFYLDADTSQYLCFSASCGERGNLVTLERFFGLEPDTAPEFVTRRQKLERFESLLVPELRSPFYERGLTDVTIERFRIGWNPEATELGGAYVIPYLDCRRPVAFRYYDPTCMVGPDGSKYWWEAGATTKLFNAQDAIGDDEGKVLVAEGELKCMLLCQLGYAAVGVPGADVFRDEWFRSFNHARQIIIVFDNDSPDVHRYRNCRMCEGACKGHNPGQKAATKLCDWFGWRARNVVLPRPSEQPKTDINEFFMRDGHTVEEFGALLTGEYASPYTVQSLAEIMEQPPDKSNFLIDKGVLVQGGRLVVTGRGKTGKSLLVQNMALSLASGQSWLGRFDVDHPTRVLLLDRELSRRSLYDRFISLIEHRPGYAAATDNLLVDHDHIFALDQPGTFERLYELVRQNRIEVIMFDTAYKFMTDVEKPRKSFEVMDKLITETGVSVVVTHHQRKGPNDRKGPDQADPDSPAGSFLWSGWPNGLVLLNFLKRSIENPFNVVCTFSSFRDAPPPDPLVLYRERDSLAYTHIAEHSWDDSEVSASPPTTTKERISEQAMANLMLDETPCTEDELLFAARSRFGCSWSVARNYMAAVMTSGQFVKEGTVTPVLRFTGDKREESWEEAHDPEQDTHQMHLVGALS